MTRFETTHTPSITNIAADVISGGREMPKAEHFGFGLRNFLDDFYAAKPAMKKAMIREEPPFLRKHMRDGGVADAYLAALANHLAYTHRLRAPAWAEPKPGNRLPDKPWFALQNPAARMWLVTQSPAAFRERNLFISADGLTRA